MRQRTSRSGDRERWTTDGLYFEYSKAANPIGAGLIPKVPLADFPVVCTRRGRPGSYLST